MYSIRVLVCVIVSITHVVYMCTRGGGRGVRQCLEGWIGVAVVVVVVADSGVTADWCGDEGLVR